MKGNLLFVALVAIAACAAPAADVIAGPISTGNIVVVQVNGDSNGGAPAVGLTGNATRVFLKEFTFGGAPVQTIAFPTTSSGSQRALTLTGSSTSEGFLHLSTDGQYLTLGGYSSALAAATTGGSNNRVVGRIALDGTVDTSTVLQLSGSGAGSIRSTASDDGTNIWVNTSGVGARYTTFGTSATSTQLSTTQTNLRVLNIYNGQLYSSSMSGAFRGVSTIGTGLPTTSGQTISLLSGFDPDVTSPESAYDYFFANAKTLYVADDRTTGGLQKWLFDEDTSEWSLAYTLNSGLTVGSTGLRGLAGLHDGTGNVTFVATTADFNTANKIVTIVDDVGTTTLPASTFTLVATAPANTVFRGIELIVPEPSALALIGLAAVGFVGVLQRRR